MKICVPWLALSGELRTGGAALCLVPAVLACGHSRLCGCSVFSPVHLSLPPFAHQAFFIPWLDQVSLKAGELF